MSREIDIGRCGTHSLLGDLANLIHSLPRSSDSDPVTAVAVESARVRYGLPAEPSNLGYMRNWR